MRIGIRGVLSVAAVILLLCTVLRMVGQEATEEPGLVRSGNATLNKALARHTLGEAATVDNLAVVPVLMPPSAKPEGEYLTLEEALEKKVLSVKELGRGGSVPTLEVSSQSDMPIFIPFGSIITGGKQDRMVREDVLLKPKETRKIAVYCVEAGRWVAGRGGGKFSRSKNVASQSLKRLGNVKASQGAIWQGVASSNAYLGNKSRSANFQGNFDTEAFQKRARELEPVKRDIAGLQNVCGAVVVINGRIAGVEIFASPAYFKKVWPQLFNSYVIDASARKEKKEANAKQAEAAARDYVSKMGTADMTQEKAKGQCRMQLDSVECLSSVLLEDDDGDGGLIYFRSFPKPEEHQIQQEQRAPQNAPNVVPQDNRRNRQKK